MAILCRPAETSHLLAYATQLPQEDQDEQGPRSSTSILDDDDDEDELLGDDDKKVLEMVGYNKYKSANGKAFLDASSHVNKAYNSLPMDQMSLSDDEEEFGIREE